MTCERWHADGGTVRDENGLAVAHVVGQDEDNSDTLLLAAAPELAAMLADLVAVLDSTGRVYADDDVANAARDLLARMTEEA